MQTVKHIKLLMPPRKNDERFLETSLCLFQVQAQSQDVDAGHVRCILCVCVQNDVYK